MALNHSGLSFPELFLCQNRKWLFLRKKKQEKGYEGAENISAVDLSELNVKSNKKFF